MPVPFRHIFRQSSSIQGLLSTAFYAMWPFRSTLDIKELPSPEKVISLPPRDPSLVRDYIEWTGGKLEDYQQSIPPHLFPQWGFPFLTKLAKNLPYPLLKVLNQGCRMTVNHPIANDESLQVRTQLVGIEDDGYRARIHQQLISGTKRYPNAVEVDVYAVVRLRSNKDKKREKPQIPKGSEKLVTWEMHSRSGWEFALLTGDFNPIHWIPSYAKVSGFANTILHGFASLARTTEYLYDTHWKEAKLLPHTIDVRFIRPLVLPSTVTLFIGPKTEGEETLPIYLTDKNEQIFMLGKITDLSQNPSSL